MIRVLVADDNEVVRFGLESLVSGDPDMDLVAAVGDGVIAVDTALEAHPDVVLMDLSMPRMDGFAAMRRIRRAAPGIRLLALSVDSREAMVRQALVAGADGYLLKECASTEILDAIRAVHRGETPDDLSQRAAAPATRSALLARGERSAQGGQAQKSALNNGHHDDPS